MSRPPASLWVVEHLDPIRKTCPLGPAVDLACGSGRNALALASAGVPVFGLDRSPDRLTELGIAAGREGSSIPTARANLESHHGVPLRSNSCGSVLILRFLFRPLVAEIERVLHPGGLLLYETFLLAHRETGRGPRSDAFYLEPGELRQLFSGLEVLAYEEGPTSQERVEISARLLARKPAPPRST